MNVGGSHVNDYFGCISKLLPVGRPKILAEMVKILGGEMVEIPRKSVPHLRKSNPACVVKDVVRGSSSNDKVPCLISFLLLSF